MGLAGTMDRTALAWAAGLFEGEGSIARHRSGSASPLLTLTMTDEDVVREFAAVVGVGTVAGPRDNGPGRKPSWRWDTTNYEHTQAVVAALWPWLKSRRRERISSGRTSAPRRTGT